MPHTTNGHLNYLSNSNLDYNNPLNVRRVGAFAGTDHHHHHPHHHTHEAVLQKGMMHKHNLSGLVVDEMGGLMEDAQENWALLGGLGLLGLPHLSKMKKKNKQLSNIAGALLLGYHFLLK